MYRSLAYVAVFAGLALLACGEARAVDGFVTATFGNQPGVEHPKTMQVQKDLIRFDLSALPAGIKVQRAILRFPFRSDYSGHSAVKLVPVGVSDKPLTTQPPSHDTLNATEDVRAWVADQTKSLGLRIVAAGRADFQNACLEVSYFGPVQRPLPVVTQLKAEHRHGQTFLTWKEPLDVVGQDEPSFEEFERAVLEARQKRQVTYRVYRHRQPITPKNIGEAEVVCQVPEAISCWNLLAIATPNISNKWLKTALPATKSQ